MDIATNDGQVQTPITQPIKPKGGIFKKFLYFCLGLIIILILGLGYLGFVPGLSKIFGSDKPRDLGVKAEIKDLESVNSKLNIAYGVLSEGSVSSLSLSGQTAISAGFSDAELTALMQKHEKLWKYYPVSNAQVKFNQDGTAEVSGILRMDRIYGYAAATGIDAKSVKEWADRLKIINNPPFYLKGKAEVKNGILTGSLEKLEIGRLPVPLSLVGSQASIVVFAQNRLDKAGIKIESGSFEKGKVNFNGQVPSKIGFLGE